MTTTQSTTAKVSITVTVNDVSHTFNATAETSGDPCRVARGLIVSVSGDASNWTHDAAASVR